MALITEQSFDGTPLRGSSDAEKREAAISMAEVALRRRWTEKFRRQQLVTVLESLDLLHPKGAAND